MPSSYPPWTNNKPTTVAYQDNVPVWPPTQPGDPNAGTKPGTAKIGVPTYKICEQSDVDSYLIPSLEASGFQCGQAFDNYATDPYPVTWGTETRRGWYLPVAGIQPPGIPWPINICCETVLPLLMAKGVGAPGYWTFDPNNIFAMMSSYGLVWNPLS